ncbi:ankyrin repeat domain-containing protein [Marinobacter sp. LV10R510-11A]|uniref:ankyrin repeat domain-containing protein n=1 Tax=Marinobacter sp. LV10R510-11A TaxID=1415568 RepID=UPI000BB98E5B|nr:ankyrin repeat domain-containing protein [Marinobacter sp. LV10R510-11A]
MSDLQLLIDIINVALVLVLIYCFFSVPAQFIRRFRRKRQGLAVSPAFLVLRNILKYWLLTALIIIPASCGLIFMLGQSAGLDGETIYAVMVTQGVAGNILTSLLLGYVFMKANKENWSEPEAEIKNSVNKLSFIKNLTIVGNDRIKKAKDKALKNTVGFYTKIETEARSIEGKRNHTPEEDARLKLEREISDEASKEEVSRLKREHEKALEDADICNRIDIESIMTREKWADFQEKHFKPIKSLKQRRLLTQFIRRYEREAFPLHKAIWNNDYNLTKTLIFFGCDITLKNSEERSVRDMAAGNVKIIALVEQAIRET